jgi:tetratricopeptide (TPR) repeat protein
VFLAGILWVGLAFGVEIPTYLTYGGTPLNIVITDFDAEGLSFRLVDTGAESSMKWLDLPASEVARLKKLVGLTETQEPGIKGFGGTIVGERFYLKGSAIPIVGEVMPSSEPDVIIINTKSVKGFKIHNSDIANREALTLYESDIYSSDEIYDRYVNRKPPKTAQDHYELANLCQELGLFQKAKGNLEVCETLDERYKERVATRLTELSKLIEEKSVKELYDEAVRAENSGHYDEALNIIDKVTQFFGQHPLANDLISRKPEIVKKRKEAIRRDVITNYYVYHERFIDNMAGGTIVDGAEIPGKLVYLKDGRTIKGMLQEETSELLVLKQDNKEYRIEKRSVSSMEDINLNTKRRNPTFDECRAYVTDPEGGITADIRKSIAKTFGITTDEVKELWADRLKEVIDVKMGSITKQASYTSLRSAGYGSGIWLRAGGANVAGAAPGNNNNDRSAGGATVETDPEKWWVKQPPTLRSQVLKALSVEAIMDVVKEDKATCPQCEGKGATQVIGTRGSKTANLCVYCHGLGYTLNLQYR